MKHIAALMMAVLGGNESPSKADVTKILSSVGISPDEERLNQLMAAVEGKSICELVEMGKEKLAAVPTGGAVAGAGAGAAPAAAAEEAAPAAEEEESEEEEEMGFDLFD